MTVPMIVMDGSISSTGNRKRKSRGRGLRTTTGCLTCRKRHVKCDGVSPKCGQCSRTGRGCTYGPPFKVRQTEVLPNTPGPIPVASQTSRSTNDLTVSYLENLTERENSSGVVDGHSEQWDHVSPDHERAQAATGLLHLNSGGHMVHVLSPDTTGPYIVQNIAEATEGPETVATPPDAAFSRWLNLLTSDTLPPIRTLDGFETLVDTNNEDSFCSNVPRDFSLSTQHGNPSIAAGRTDPDTERTGLSFASHPTLPIPESLTQHEPWHVGQFARLNFREQSLFEHFVKNISTWIDLFDQKLHFSTFVPHLAMRDAGLMNAILALSARALSISSNAADAHQNANISIQYYNETLRSLQKAMHHDTFKVSHELLATALIVSTYEMLDESGAGWERHLEGVFWIQRSQLIQGESGGLKQSVWWAWLRQDVWAAFRERRKTFSYWTPTRHYKEMQTDEVALRSVWLFARAVDYSSRAEIEAGSLDLSKRMERAKTILDMLDDWNNNLSDAFTPLPARLDDKTAEFQEIWIHPPALAVAVQLHHSARLLVLLHRPSAGGIRYYMTQQKLFDSSVAIICGIAMALKDDASSIMSSQCLFIAGLCTQEPQKRTKILELIDKCQSRTGWPTKSLSEELRIEWENLDYR